MGFNSFTKQLRQTKSLRAKSLLMFSGLQLFLEMDYYLCDWILSPVSFLLHIQQATTSVARQRVIGTPEFIPILLLTSEIPIDQLTCPLANDVPFNKQRIMLRTKLRDKQLLECSGRVKDVSVFPAFLIALEFFPARAPIGNQKWAFSRLFSQQ